MCILHHHVARPQRPGVSSWDCAESPSLCEVSDTPMGLPNLKGISKERVRLANKLYAITAKYVLILHDRNIGWSVENPASSLMWVTDEFVRLMQNLGVQLHGVLFHTCMFGAPRKKQTALWTNICEPRTCNDAHEHAPWGLTHSGSFATAEECAYNSELCAHWAAAIEQFALNRGLHPAPSSLDDVDFQNLHLKDKANKAILGAPPKGSKLPPLLTDFLEETVVPVQHHACLEQAKPGARLADNAVFPKGARLLQVWNDQVGSTEGEPTLVAKVGIPVTPLKYVAMASQLIHPDLQRVKLSPQLQRAISFCGPGRSLELRKLRIQWTKDVVALMGQTRDEEDRWSSLRPRYLQKVLDGKRFCLMHRTLNDMGYADASVAEEASTGFPLVGWMRASNVFASNVRPPELHVSALETMAASYSARTIASVQLSLDAELDAQVWQATLDEVAFDVSELPAGHVASPRFGIRQGQKVRPI